MSIDPTVDSASVSSVSIKPAQFSQASPAPWFAILEAQFHIAGISNPTTQFYHALSHLPPDTVGRLPEKILTGKLYEDLKMAVVSFHEETKPELFEHFMRDTPLVGRPSHFLAEMKRVAAKVGVSDELVRHKFQQAVPHTMAPILASQKGSSLDDLGKLADELVSLCPVSGSSNLVSRSTSLPAYRSNSSAPQQDFSLTPFKPGQRSKVCRAHIFYGKNAHSCRSWCQWPSKETCRIASRRNTPNHSRSSSPTPNKTEN